MNYLFEFYKFKNKMYDSNEILLNPNSVVENVLDFIRMKCQIEAKVELDVMDVEGNPIGLNKLSYFHSTLDLFTNRAVYIPYYPQHETNEQNNYGIILDETSQIFKNIKSKLEQNEAKKQKKAKEIGNLSSKNSSPAKQNHLNKKEGLAAVSPKLKNSAIKMNKGRGNKN